MVRILKVGDQVNGYTVGRCLNRGAMAIAYEAAAPSGERVFFKQYKSPSPTVPWFKSYVAQQDELKRRIETSEAKRFTYKLLDFFETDLFGATCYFQVFEFVEHGSDLRGILDRLHEDPAYLPMGRRLTLSKVMLGGISALHQARIVHSDLKPENIQLFEDASIGVGFILKVIDMDFSILSDRRAAWDGFQGYVGSPNYLSPEHLLGKAPLPASDMFTCGLMLLELLRGSHPYASDEQEDYQKAVLSWSAPVPDFSPYAWNPLAKAIHNCLCPDPSKRPTVDELRLVLLKDTPIASSDPLYLPIVVPPLKVPIGSPVVPRPPAPELSTAGSIRIVHPLGMLTLSIRTEVGKHLLGAFGEEVQFADTHQFTLEKAPEGPWWVVPNPDAVNETILNGKMVSGRTQLADGDRVCVGRTAKGVYKLPMVIHLD